MCDIPGDRNLPCLGKGVSPIWPTLPLSATLVGRGARFLCRLAISKACSSRGLWSRSEVVLRCADGLSEGCRREPAKKILYLIKTLNRQNCDFKARLAKPNNRDEPSITSVNKYDSSQHKASFNDVHNASMIN